MYNAPPVAYPVGRFIWARAVWAGVLLVSATGLTTWQWVSQAPSATAWSAWLFWALCAVVSACVGPRQVISDGHLLWTGEIWVWRSGRGPAALSVEDQGLELTVGMDFGVAILLFLRADPLAHEGRSPRLWAWVSQRSMPSMWHGFRCAVYSRPKPHELVEEAEHKTPRLKA